MVKDKKTTVERFGNYIDKYKLQDAVDDGTTVQILYEDKTPDTAVKDKAKFDEKVDTLASKHVASQMRKSENVSLVRKMADRENRPFDNLVRELISISCKNPAFKDEKEWRIVYQPSILRGNAGLEVLGGNSDIFFRTSKLYMVPYFKLAFAEKRDTDPITEIILGPKRCLTEEADRLSWILEKNGSSCGTLKQSAATYR